MVAAANGVGGDGCVRVRAREKEQRGGASRKSERGPRGLLASREGTRGGGGSQAGRRWPGRVAARAGRVPASFWRGKKTTGGVAVAGWASGRSWAGQVSR